MTRRLLLLPLAALLIAAGCGGSGGDPEADPSAAVPARAPLYLEASIESDEDFEAVARKLSGEQDPSGELKRLLERAANEGGGDFKYDEDVKPWIGDRFGVFFTSLEGEEPEGAIVAAVKDADKAEEVLHEELSTKGEDEQPPKVADRTYKDTEYKVDTANNNAVLVGEDHAVFGSEQGVKDAIDGQKGEALSEADAFKKARDQVDDDALGFGYVRMSELLGSLGPQGAAARQVLGQSGDTIAFSLDAEANEITVESAAVGVKGSAGATGPGEMLGALPGDAWVAGGTADLGGQLERQLEQFSQLGAFGGVNVDQMLEQFRSQTGVDLREDLLGWMGDAALFVSGSTLSDIGGALVIKSKDAAKSSELITKLERVASRLGQGQVSLRRLRPSGGLDFDRGVQVRPSGELPLPISIVSAGDRFVIAVGQNALESALKPAEALRDSQAFKDAAGRLDEGLEPSLFVNLDPVKTLLNDTGAWQQAGPEGERAKRAFEQLTTIVAGGQREDDVQRGELVIGVK